MAENFLALTNISYGQGKVLSVINIDETSIALCTDNGIDVYNKKNKRINLQNS